MHVIVIGAGIIGASAAYYLTRSGASVTVIDAQPDPGGVATPASFSWINASHGNPRHYFELRMHAIDGWRRLETRFPNGTINLCGGVWAELEGRELEDGVRMLAQWGYDIRLVDRLELARLEPGLAHPPAMAAIASDEGMVESERFAAMLLSAASPHLLYGTEVLAVETGNGRCRGVRTTAGSMAADAVLVAAGAGSTRLLGEAGFELPVTTPPGLLLHTRPAKPLLNRLVITKAVHARQRADGSFLAGADFIGSFDPDDPEGAARELLEGLRQLVGDFAIEMDRWTVGRRPTPGDGFPAAGPVPGVEGVFVAVSHSGVTLAPALGEMMAGEIVTGEVHPLLERFRAARFAGSAADAA